MSNYKFPASSRLLTSQDFSAVFDSNDLRSSKPSLLFLAKLNQRGFNRLGIVVSKKNIPRAVDRNRLKRSIRESFRRNMSEQSLLDGANSLDVIVLARPKARQHKTLSKELDANFSQLNKDSGKDKNT
jgi:ribonuclease P protein component